MRNNGLIRCCDFEPTLRVSKSVRGVVFYQCRVCNRTGAIADGEQEAAAAWERKFVPASEAHLKNVDMDCLRAVRRYAQANRTDFALDVLYDHIDALLCDSEFSRVDEMLASIMPAMYPTDILLGFLTITMAAKSKLKQREQAARSFEITLRDRPEWTDGLLSGLL